MTFAIDYDDTWTADPALMAAVADLLRGEGHTVYLVTARPEDRMDGVAEAVAGHVDGVFATGLTGKREFMWQRDIHIDIFIDDAPEFVCGCYFKGD